MKNILYLVLFAFTISAISQNTKINIGDKQNQKLAYIDAIKTYEKIVKKGFVNAEICEKIADAYTKFAKAANGLNIKAVQASTQMFDSLAKLANPDAQNAMKILTQDLLKAVEQLSKTVVNLETAVEKQGEMQEDSKNSMGGLFDKTIGALTNLTDNATKTTVQNTPLTPEELAKQKEAAGKIDPALAKAIEAMNAVLKQINDKIAVGTDRNGALGIRVVAQ